MYIYIYTYYKGLRTKLDEDGPSDQTGLNEYACMFVCMYVCM